MRLVRVAVPVPALDSLTYRIPPELETPAVGGRVLVPLGDRVVTGCVLAVDTKPALVSRDPLLPDPDSHAGEAADGAAGSRPTSAEHAGQQTAAVVLSAQDTAPAAVPVKPIIDLLDDQAFLPEPVLRLATWVAEYYACGIGEAIAAAMPPRSWIESQRHAQITELGHARLLTERGVRRAILERLADDRPKRLDRLTGSGRGAYTAAAALERDGLIALRRPLKGSAAAFRSIRIASLTAQGHDVAERLDAADAPRLGPKQREALSLLLGAPAGLSASELTERGIAAGSLHGLARLGLVTFTRRQVERDPFESATATGRTAPPIDLTTEQRSALDRLEHLAGSRRFQGALLHGVTGSGKTEIYLRLADAVRRQGRGALLLVPEIALTPAMAAIFRAAFGTRVAIQHSGLSDGERYDQWHRIRRGDVDVVVGTRSAVFAPLPDLGLIVVDEEHDGSYKQEEAPRYNGRDVAVMRASQAGALVVLGSATPSMESYQNALSGRYALVTLDKRVLDRPLAQVEIVDMREEYAASGPDVILSARLCEALEERFSRREQAVVLLNRRGFATTVFCRQCGHTLECPNCSLSLTVHRAARRARCHYCNYSMTLPKACVKCAGPYLEHLGFGTERVESEILARFPHARVARVDRDTIVRKGAITTVLSRFAAGEIDVLVGTQMIAKGHDFPRVTLVGVVSADVGLGLADFRAAERTFQLLTQVAGRAGRGVLRGRAVVQTLFPNHYSIQHACRQDYAAFFQEEINFRRAMRYPPIVAMVNVVVRARTEQAAMEDAGEIARALRWGGEPYRVLGPATAPLSRLKGEHRAQLFLKGRHRQSMREALLRVMAERLDIRRRTVIDVDPMSVL